MKKLLIMTALLFSLCGCTAEKEKTVVSASFYPIYITTLNIAKGANIEVQTLAKPSTGCLHDYQLTSGDIRALNDADLFVINGAGMEDGFMEEVIATNENLYVVDSSVGVTPIEACEEPDHDHEEHDHEGHDHDHSVNSHIWLNPENAIIQAENIAKELCKVNPENSPIYEKNLEEYVSKLTEINDLYKGLSVKTPTKAIVLNDGFHYLCEPYGIEVSYTIELDSNSTTSAKQLADIIDSAAENNYIILAAKGEHSALANTLNRELNIPVFELDPVTYGELKNENAYIDAMKENYEVIKEILG